MSDKPSRFYKVWILFIRHKFYMYGVLTTKTKRYSLYGKDYTRNGRPILGLVINPLPQLNSHLTIFRDIIKGQQVANPMLHGMVLPLLLSGKITNQNNNQNITKPTTPNR